MQSESMLMPSARLVLAICTLGSLIAAAASRPPASGYHWLIGGVLLLTLGGLQVIVYFERSVK